MTTTTQRTRLDLKLSSTIKTKAEKASALLGYKSLTDYVVRVLDKHASEVIKNNQGVEVPPDIFDRFIKACENADKPNQALRDAFSVAKQKGLLNDERIC